MHFINAFCFFTTILNLKNVTHTGLYVHLEQSCIKRYHGNISWDILFLIFWYNFKLFSTWPIWLLKPIQGWFLFVKAIFWRLKRHTRSELYGKRLKFFDPVQNIQIMLRFDGSTYMGKFGRDTTVRSWPNFRGAFRITDLPRIGISKKYQDL